MLASPFIIIFGVALRKESVDRNSEIAKEYIRVVQSLSARRAWIEMAVGILASPVYRVALRKELSLIHI